MNRKHREQVADLILQSPDGEDLVVVSTLTCTEDGASCFLVGEDAPEGARYKVTIKREEV